MDQQALFGSAGVAMGGRRLRVYDPSGVKFTELDVETGEYSTPVERPDERAKNVQIAVARQDVALRYISTSAMHKEIRRGDLGRVREWARTIGEVYGKGRIKQYVRGVVLEETRNTQLLEDWQSVREYSGEVMALQLAASTKKWELPGRVALWEQYCAAFDEVRDTGELRFEWSESTQLMDLLRLRWAAQLVGDQDSLKTLTTALAERARESGYDHASVVHTMSDACHGLETLIEVACKMHDPMLGRGQAAIPLRSFSESLMVVPPIPSYVYDAHTRPGKAKLAKMLHQVEVGKSQPDGVDLRWTGMIRGVGWRSYAFDQFKEGYKDVPWEAVSIPPKIWRSIVRMDNLFFPTLAQDV